MFLSQSPRSRRVFLINSCNLWINTLHSLQCLREVFDDVLDVFRTDGESDGGGSDVLLFQLLGRELRVGGRIWVNHQTLHVGDVRQQRENLQGIDEAPCLLLTALDLKGEDRTAALREVLLIEAWSW